MANGRCACPEPEVDLTLLDRIILEDFGGNREATIMMMQAIQAHYRYLPEAALRHLSARLGVPLTKLYEVATFYASFSLEPKGRHILSVCTGTACHLRGSHRMVEHLCQRLGVTPGGTTPDKEFTLETVNCVGACAVAPVVVLDGEYRPKAEIKAVDQFLDHAKVQ